MHAIAKRRVEGSTFASIRNLRMHSEATIQDNPVPAAQLYCFFAANLTSLIRGHVVTEGLPPF